MIFLKGILRGLIALSLILLFGWLTSDFVQADDFTVAQLVSIHDGDTIKVNLDCDQPVFCKAISVRLSGINTAEMNSKDRKERLAAIKARAMIGRLISHAKKIELKDSFRDKYFRLNARVVADGVDVGQAMLKSGLAKPYDGSGPKEW